MMACLVLTPYRPHPTFGTSRVAPIVARVTQQDDSRTATAVVNFAHRAAALGLVTRITPAAESRTPSRKDDQTSTDRQVLLAKGRRSMKGGWLG
jgi:uncharacterized membrane protein YdbT with pleckstrin-like domain